MKRGTCNTRHAERGAAMLLAVALMGVFAIVGGACWRHLHVSLAQVRDTAKAQLSRELAEAGLARAVAELRAGNTSFTGAERVPLGEGVYSVSLAPAADGARAVTATGALADGNTLRREVKIRALLHTGSAGQVEVEYLGAGD